nr:myeloid differentiation primary response protein MyD88 isoform X1 [Osmia lignaria]
MTVNLSTVPLVALSGETKQIISTLLNPPKIIPSENGLPRDWRGLAHLSNLGGEILPLLTSHSDPSAYILTTWRQKQKDITIKDLQVALEEIDRWDIVDDTLELFEKDAIKYLEQLERSQTSADIIAGDDTKILTVDDIHRSRQGLDNQYYDAFLLYADEDINFATKMIDKLESQYKLKLCLKDRDLIGGITFEHEAVITLISERCNRLIVIVSSNFLESPANKFFLNYAQALGIDKGQRKVIPCLYGKCQLPRQLNYMFILDYNRVTLYNFWEKLRDSVQIVNAPKSNTNCITVNEEPVLLSKKEATRNTVEINSEYETEKNTVKDQVLKGNDKSSDAKQEPNNPELNKDSNKTINNFLRWNWKKRGIRKAERDNEEYVSITKTVNLPSLENLDPLNTSTDLTEKKQKPKFLKKYVKKVPFKL